jgi:short-subunit dehydrogenase
VKLGEAIMTTATLITGASAGLGEGFARKLAAEGHNLVLVARRTDRLESLAAELAKAHGIQTFVETCDLAKPDAGIALVKRVSDQGIEIDCLINNAGFGTGGDFASSDLVQQTNMITVNCTALMQLCHAVLPAMLARKSGSILNVASSAAFQAGPYMAVYYATKAFVLSFSEALHEEVKAAGIHVSALCPGPTDTEFFATAKLTKSLLAIMSRAQGPVIDDGLRALKANKAFVVSGFLNKLSAQATRIAPRAMTRKIAARLQH